MTLTARSPSLCARSRWLAVALAWVPTLGRAQESPFLTGATALQQNIVSQLSATYGADAHTIIENCGNTLILRCSASENGGTSQYAARLIGDREVIRRQRSRGRDNPGGLFSGGARRSTQISDQRLVEPAVLAAQVEQLADLSGYLKIASSPVWQAVRIGR
jgi:hypothetical protein